MPKVSIIMPVYNKDMYLDKTLKLICSQTYLDWELIVVNDGSTDNSLSIVNNFKIKDNRIHVFSKKNGGVSSARNLGISKACGEWIWFVDADDEPDIYFLEKAMSINNKEASIIVGNFRRVYNDSYSDEVKIEFEGEIPKEVFPEIFMKNQYNNGYWGYLWNKVIKRNFIESKGIQFKIGLTLAEDLLFMIQLYSYQPKIYIIDVNAMDYTVEAKNSSSQKRIDYFEQLNIQLMIYDWIVKKSKKVEFEKNLRIIISNYAACIVFYSFEYKMDYRKIARVLMINDKINPLLMYDGVDKIMVPIIAGLKKRKMIIITSYLRIRNLLRKIYRKMRRGYNIE